MFHHILVTRFNLRNSDWDVTKNNEELLTEDWMLERMWFFENFCIPSIIAQTNQNFEWLLYFDTTTPQKYRDQMADLIRNQPNFKMFYIDGMSPFYDEFTSYINNEKNKKPHLITTRIDNDDAVHKDFINEIQLQFKNQDHLVLDIIKGYSLQIRPTVMLGKKEHVFNPFMSLIEKNVNPKTIMFYKHNMWKKETRIKQITHKRLWIAVIHEKNKINNFNGYSNVIWNNLKEDFVLSEEANTLIKNELIPHSKWRKLSWKNKFIVKYKVFSKNLKKIFGVYKIK